jgi:hypothetical protein
MKTSSILHLKQFKYAVCSFFASLFQLFVTFSEENVVEQPFLISQRKKILRPFNEQFIYFRQKIPTDALTVQYLPPSCTDARLTLVQEMADNCPHVYSCEASSLSMRRPVDHALLRAVHRRRGVAADGGSLDAVPLHGLRDEGRGLFARHLASQHAAHGTYHRPRRKGSVART